MSLRYSFDIFIIDTNQTVNFIETINKLIIVDFPAPAVEPTMAIV
jgi:hypothetical protein